MSTITNFRDIGGITNKQGHQVISGKIFRSGELSALSSKQSQQLEDEYKLGKIVDFRSQKEVSERPDRIVPNTKYVHIDILEQVEDNGASMSDFVTIGSAEKAKLYMKQLYQDIAVDSAAQKGYTKFFEEILSTNEKTSVLFHCFAGKDRTGIGAALILETLDVPKEAIYADYLRTNELRQKENALLLADAKEKGLQENHLAALDVALNVDRSYLDGFYEIVNKEFGTVADYLTSALKLNQSMLKELNARLISQK